MKILLSAYACEPGRGSEPEVGWRWALLLAQRYNVTVLTRANNRPAIEAALAALPGPHPEFVYYDPSPFWLRLKKKGLPVGLFYLLWQAGVRRLMRHRLREFDLIHHVTFNSFSRPGFWWWTGKPVVLGPLGGGQVVPSQMLPLFHKTRWNEVLRALYVKATPFYPPFLLSCAQASLLLVANEDTARRIPRRHWPKVARFLETGVGPDEVAIKAEGASVAGEEVRVIWVSRLDEIKSPELALRAFAHAARREPRLRMTMVGDGPQMAWVRALVEELELEASVTLVGRLPREEILAHLCHYDLFFFTSLRDTSGNVLLEGLAAGLPAVCLRHHGAAEITTDACARRVPPTNVDETIRRLADALVELAAEPLTRRTMGRHARQRVEALYLWPQKLEILSAFYERALQS